MHRVRAALVQPLRVYEVELVYGRLAPINTPVCGPIAQHLTLSRETLHRALRFKAREHPAMPAGPLGDQMHRLRLVVL